MLSGKGQLKVIVNEKAEQHTYSSYTEVNYCTYWKGLNILYSMLYKEVEEQEVVSMCFIVSMHHILVRSHQR